MLSGLYKLIHTSRATHTTTTRSPSKAFIAGIIIIMVGVSYIRLLHSIFQPSPLRIGTDRVAQRGSPSTKNIKTKQDSE